MASSEVPAEKISAETRAEFVCYPPSSEQACWAVATLKAPFYEPAARAPVDIVAVIDKSGSMRGVKLELVKKTLLFVIDQLKECDRLSLVTYDTQVKLEFGLTRMDKASKERIRSLVERLRDGSCTNLCGGLMQGMQEIAGTSGGECAQVQSVLLLTDGLANEGIRSKDGILEEMKKLQQPPAAEVASKKFVGTVYTFGFGSDHDASMLEAIATQGGGVYYYIDAHEKIPESFADCLGGLLSVMGQNLTLKLEAKGENSISAVHANRTINWTTANKSCDIAMGDLQSEEERDIVLELKLPAVPSPGPDTILSVSLSYFNVMTSCLDTVSCELTVGRTDGAQGPPSESLDTQRNRIIATNALREAQPLADQGKLAEAKKLLQDAITLLQASVAGKTSYCQALIEDLQRSLASMKSREEYNQHGKHYMHSKAQAHSVQRSNFVDDHEYYQNRSKASYRVLSKK